MRSNNSSEMGKQSVDAGLEYIEEQLLTEEDDDAAFFDKGGDVFSSPSRLHHHVDPLALQAMEKSFFQALNTERGQQQQPQPCFPRSSRWPDNHQYCSISSNSSSSSSGSGGNNEASSSSADSSSMADGACSSVSEIQYALFQFQKGVEEASRFLPRSHNLLLSVDEFDDGKAYKKPRSLLFYNNTTPSTTKEEDLAAKLNPNATACVAVQSNSESHQHAMIDETNRRRKERSHHHHHHHQEVIIIDVEDDVGGGGDERRGEEEEEEEPPSSDTDELSEMFQKINMGSDFKHKSPLENIRDIVTVNKMASSSAAAGGCGKLLILQDAVIVDLRSLLLDCARFITCDDHKSAHDQLNVMRQHCSPFGDGNQRLAHCFANALESRMAGTGPQVYATLATSLSPSIADETKAHQSFVSVCPFRLINFRFAIHHISTILAAHNHNPNHKPPTLHIIDFGINSGFLISRIIHHLLASGGPPPAAVRVTGIEVSGESDMVKKTGRRLAKFCGQHNLRFDYQGIAQKWETIRIEDLRVAKNETVVVTSFLQFERLQDEIAGVDSPRTAVLNLIRKIDPHIFLHFAINGSFTTPLFFQRFREALFHYSTWFDMLDFIWSRDNGDRLMFERCFFGAEVMNIVACEGAKRVERAETCRQWQIRMGIAGFQQLPLERKLVQTLRGIVKEGFHKDFMFEEDGHWILQGWKGRTLCGSCCWVPARH